MYLLVTLSPGSSVWLLAALWDQTSPPCPPATPLKLARKGCDQIVSLSLFVAFRLLSPFIPFIPFVSLSIFQSLVSSLWILLALLKPLHVVFNPSPQVNLSGGQQQRVCLARACYAKSDIVSQPLSQNLSPLVQPEETACTPSR